MATEGSSPATRAVLGCLVGVGVLAAAAAVAVAIAFVGAMGNNEQLPAVGILGPEDDGVLLVADLAEHPAALELIADSLLRADPDDDLGDADRDDLIDGLPRFAPTDAVVVFRSDGGIHGAFNPRGMGRLMQWIFAVLIPDEPGQDGAGERVDVPHGSLFRSPQGYFGWYQGTWVFGSDEARVVAALSRLAEGHGGVERLPEPLPERIAALQRPGPPLVAVGAAAHGVAGALVGAHTADPALGVTVRALDDGSVEVMFDADADASAEIGAAAVEAGHRPRHAGSGPRFTVTVSYPHAADRVAAALQDDLPADEQGPTGSPL